MIDRFLLKLAEKDAGDHCLILMALDGIYRNGKLVKSGSGILISNDHVINAAKMNNCVNFGLSVHPYRRAEEMLAETRRCIEEGAAFFHWLPAFQRIDPEDDRCVPFYKCLERAGIPLLCHIDSNDRQTISDTKVRGYNNPDRLTKALDIGVKVIVSYLAGEDYQNDLPADSAYFEEILAMLNISEAKNWEFYFDISACCSPAWIMHLERIKREIDYGAIRPERFVCGAASNFFALSEDIFKSPLNLKELSVRIKANMKRHAAAACMKNNSSRSQLGV